MKPIGVFYATREGHTQHIAGHIAAKLGACGFEPEVCNLRDPQAAGRILLKTTTV